MTAEGRARTPGLSPEAAAAAVFAVLIGVLFLPVWLRGLSFFWGDLTYIHHPWRALPAQLIQAGRAPLWNPYLYFGMPMAAEMQGSLYYPGTVPFFVFGFSTATALFQAAHYWLASWLMFLWLKRSAGLSGAASLGGAAVFGLCGFMAGRLPFLNHLATLSLLPAFLIFFRKPALLGLSLALAFLCGYPPFLIGGAAAVWATLAAAGHRDFSSKAALGAGLARWAAAGALAMALSACLLFPAAELTALCRRASGIALEEVLEFGFGPVDLLQWVAPWAVAGKFDPAVEWWKAAYLGMAALFAVGTGVAALPRRRALGLCALLGATALLILGNSNPLSLAAWTYLPGLRMVRYPGNMAYLALPALALLAACGFSRKGRGLLAAAAAVELTVYGLGASPAASRELFTSGGPLVRKLQAELGGARYLLSPLALETHQGANLLDWKHRLYGLTNAPFRIAAGGNFGEPLVPRSTYDAMDFLYRQPGAAKAARHLAWAGVRFLLSPNPPPEGTLIHEGSLLWEIGRVPGEVSLAYLLTHRAGENLPAGLPESAPKLGPVLGFERSREDRFEVRAPEGAPPGWAYVAEPRYPGWKVFLDTPAGVSEAESLPALGAFQRIKVPEGPWRLIFRYEPPTFRWGAALTAAALLGLALYWYNCGRNQSRLPDAQ